MSDAAKRLKRHFLGVSPPTAESAVNNLTRTVGRPPRPRSEPSVQFNLRLPMSAKKRIRLLAARDSITMSDVVLRGIDLYEEKNGTLPKL